MWRGCPSPETRKSSELPIVSFLTLILPILQAHSVILDIILDTGTTLNYVPTDVADAFAAAFDPPAKFSEDEGLYVTTCNATIPLFTVDIGGTTFTVDQADNILPLGTTDSEGNELCGSGTTGQLVFHLGFIVKLTISQMEDLLKREMFSFCDFSLFSLLRRTCLLLPQR